EKRPYVIENCSLTLRRGQRVAVIGPSGAGKSTLVAMLLRVVEPETGELTIDGHSYNAFDIRDLRKNVAWLSQTTHIFADTIRNNLCLGGCYYPEEALWNALSQAGLAHVVKDLPDGLDSWVGEGGKALSGGEGRRLVLARILLSDAPIIILDEPTTGLDAETAESFFKTFEAATKDKTVLLVLHRLTGTEKLDLVWKLGDGHVK
ncbi:uncharacterized protein LOC108865100, partial [Galendromus occidentalis]|uniref:Uncharacterized protein LOC108865100 n=1 Tax=Galendromus occidentalis TaxID=34638 RepID=A0AAJ7L6J8_9ACAR